MYEKEERVRGKTCMCQLVVVEDTQRLLKNKEIINQRLSILVFLSVEAVLRHRLPGLSINYLVFHYCYYTTASSLTRKTNLPTRRSEFLDFGARSVFYNHSSPISNYIIKLQRYYVHLASGYVTEQK